MAGGSVKLPFTERSTKRKRKITKIEKLKEKTSKDVTDNL